VVPEPVRFAIALTGSVTFGADPEVDPAAPVLLEELELHAAAENPTAATSMVAPNIFEHLRINNPFTDPPSTLVYGANDPFG
jgi:hypothetical protein